MDHIIWTILYVKILTPSWGTQPIKMVQIEFMPWFLVLVSDRRFAMDSDDFEFKDECVLEALMTVSLIPAQSSFEVSSFPFYKFTKKINPFEWTYDTLVRGEFQNEPFRRLGAILPQLGDNWLRVRSADDDTPLRFELRFDRPECGVAHGLFRFQKRIRFKVDGQMG